MDVAKQAFHSEDTSCEDDEEEEEEREASPKAVGHNIFILAHQVSHFLDFDVLSTTWAKPKEKGVCDIQVCFVWQLSQHNKVLAEAPGNRSLW